MDLMIIGPSLNLTRVSETMWPYDQSQVVTIICCRNENRTFGQHITSQRQETIIYYGPQKVQREKDFLIFGYVVDGFPIPPPLKKI